MKKQIKSNKAITLIIVVIIIAIILILAGVGIAILMGKQNSTNQEQNQNNNNNQQSEIDVENTELPEYAGKKYDEETEIKIEKVPVTIPEGATISGISGEYENIDDGLVIYIIPEETEIKNWEEDKDNNGIIDVQENYDQFVWVPVENAIAQDINGDKEINATDINEMISEEKYPMAIPSGTIEDEEGNTITNYKGILYNFTLNNRKIEVSFKDYTTRTAYREPVYLTDENYADESNYNNIEITESSLQQEFNKMVEKINENKGFWVGRYETSNMVSDKEKDNKNQIKVVKGTTKGINNVNWYRMYSQQKNYSNLIETSSTSSMLWGSQWDQIMIWMKNVKNNKNTVTTNSYYVVNAIGMGNYGVDKDGKIVTNKEIEKTGSSEDYKVKNIYDIAGNVYDWTLEGARTNYRIARGGLFNDTNAANAKADFRYHYYPKYSYSNIGTRSTIY